jgi:hypothetical protein
MSDTDEEGKVVLLSTLGTLPYGLLSSLGECRISVASVQGFGPDSAILQVASFLRSDRVVEGNLLC